MKDPPRLGIGRAPAAWARRRAADGLRRRAQNWVVKLDAGALSEADQRRFSRWLARPGAQDALAGQIRVWEQVDALVAQDRLAALRPAPLAPRRGAAAAPVLAGLLAGVGALALWLAAPPLWVLLSADARTGLGERRAVLLEDGSRILLDSDSAVDVAFAARARRVRLLKGRAFFQVAANPARPFVVEAEGGSTTALGTAFVVDRQGEGVRVDGLEHRVRVAASGRQAVLGPGQTLRYGAGVRAFAAGPTRAGASSWLRGVLLFDRTPVDAAADEIGRYTATRIWVIGAARRRSVSGVFQTAAALEGFEAAAQTAGLHLRRLPGLLLVTAG